MDTDQGMILIDVAPGEEANFDQRFLERNGHRVVMCHGPDHGSLCPILSHVGCSSVMEAHGIVFVLDLDRPQHRQHLLGPVLDKNRRMPLGTAHSASLISLAIAIEHLF